MGRIGTTVPELASALLLLAVIAAMGLPPLRLWLDRLAVSSAREEAVALFSAARREAPGRGGAVVRLDPEAHTGAIVIDGEGRREVSFQERFGVELDLGGGGGGGELRYDALGLGRAASRTVRFRRGGAESALVVSSYGRVRRR